MLRSACFPSDFQSPFAQRQRLCVVFFEEVNISDIAQCCRKLEIIVANLLFRDYQTLLKKWQRPVVVTHFAVNPCKIVQ